MYSFDDYFEYALDLPDEQRKRLLTGLRAEDPALATRLAQALADQVKNADFLCQTSLPVRRTEPDRLHHVTLVVDDVVAAARWYTEAFRCRVVRQDGERAVIAFGTTEVHLVSRDAEPPSLTILREDVASLGSTTRRRDGVRAMRLVDPWGNAIEVVDGPPPADPLPPAP